MKVHGVIVEDQTKGVFFGFIRKFPAICAQGDSREEVVTKINAYYKAYMERMKNADVEMGESQVFAA